MLPLLAILCAAQSAPDDQLLRDLPHIAKVEASIVVEKPTHYLIHILDWHFVEKDSFIADMRSQGINDDLDAKYAKHLNDVEAVQNQQKELLLALVENRGVTEVYIEGLAKAGQTEFETRLKELKRLGDKMRVLTKLSADVEDAELKKLLETTGASFRREMFRIGAVGQLHMEGKLKALPADDEKAHAAAQPIGPDGQVKLDEKLIEARESAMVKIVVADAPVSVLILGGAHDLSNNVPDDCQYIRVSTRAYPTNGK